MKKLATFIMVALLTVVMAMGLAACGSGGFKLSETEATVFIGDTLTLKATNDGVAVAGKDISWETSNKDVATVKNGEVTGVAAGEATITAKTGSVPVKTATCKITVTEDTTKLFTLHSDLPNEKGEPGACVSDLTFYNTGKVKLIGFVQSYYENYNIELDYTTTDGKLAIPGTIEMLTLDVKEEAAAFIGLVHGPATMHVREIKATLNGNSLKIAGMNDEWGVGDQECVLGVWELSEANATALGVTLGEKANVPVESVTFGEKTLEMQAGDVRMVKTTVKPIDASNPTVTLTSSNEEALKIESGKWKAQNVTEETTVTVTATADGKSDTCTVTVKPKAADVLVVLADGNVDGDWIRVSLKAEGNAVIEGVLRTQVYEGTAKYTTDDNLFPVLTNATITTKGDNPATYALTFTSSDVKEVYGIKFIGITITAKPAEGDEFELGVASTDGLTCAALATKPASEYLVKADVDVPAALASTMELHFQGEGKLLVKGALWGMFPYEHETTYTYSGGMLTITAITVEENDGDTVYTFTVSDGNDGAKIITITSKKGDAEPANWGTATVTASDLAKLSA